ncbi:MAG TPA: nucleotidyltransferase family protein [Blastocatellia bacterium]|jgi:molybdenum cofactor cytidylyltransferase|nr:nucleotidyltransferase family protein [Blastocatellia bacterium]
MISAVLLAAGESRRMGEFKQLLPFGGKPFVECCVDNLLASRVDEVIVITGHRESDVRAAVGGRPVRFAHNPDYRGGMSSSIRRGVEAVSKESRACLVALVDQPQIGNDVINRVVEAYEKDQPLIVIPAYGGRNGHPIILDLKLKDEILSIGPAEGLRQVVHAHSSEVVRVEISTDVVLTDFDYPEDYRRILKS